MDNEEMEYQTESDYEVKTNTNTNASESPAQPYCIWSLVLLIINFFSSLVLGIFSTIVGLLIPFPAISGPIIATATVAVGLSAPASIVLMIIARVKDKNSVFAKVLMWIWIVLIIAAIIIGILAVLFISWLCGQCLSTT